MKAEDLHTEFKASFGDEVMPLLVFFTNKRKGEGCLLVKNTNNGEGFDKALLVWGTNAITLHP